MLEENLSTILIISAPGITSVPVDSYFLPALSGARLLEGWSRKALLCRITLTTAGYAGNVKQSCPMVALYFGADITRNTLG